MVNAVKVFKKTAPNGKISVYLGKRDFIDNTISTEPVNGVVMVDNDYLRGRKVFGTVTVTYRFGREEDEMMGLNFSKEMELVSTQLYPQTEQIQPDDVQDRLIKKLGANAYPFSVNLPQNAPASVHLQPGKDIDCKPLGVIYELRVYAGDRADDKQHKRNSVTLAVRKVQYAPASSSKRQPSTLVSKGFTLSPGKLSLEVTLDREIYYHGEQVSAQVNINNHSQKSVKNVKCSIIQHVEVTMTNNHFTREVAGMDSKEGCPISPGANMSKNISLQPSAQTNRSKVGVALDGKLKDQDVNLASSTLCAQGKNVNDSLGIIVSYSLRVKLNCGAIGGELTADLPFKMLHPNPECGVRAGGGAATDEMVFEDFAKLRRGMSYDQY